MTRQMIDVTEIGFSAALPVIQALNNGDLVGLYDTGSPTIVATAGMISKIPKDLGLVMIDQGFTGSPNFSATVRDVENGAWLIGSAVDKTNWHVPRPTLYVGFPNTVQEVFNAGWRGDIWVVSPSSHPPVSPPVVPAGLNVVAVQWDFSNPAFDKSVVFDGSWPMATPTVVVPQVPPGPWKDAKEWDWQQVQIIGRGLDNVLYTFEYHVKTGQWVRISSPVGT